MAARRLNAPASEGGRYECIQELGEQLKIVATNSTMIVLKDTGHWVLEEQPTRC